MALARLENKPTLGRAEQKMDADLRGRELLLDVLREHHVVGVDVVEREWQLVHVLGLDVLELEENGLLVHSRELEQFFIGEWNSEELPDWPSEEEEPESRPCHEERKQPSRVEQVELAPNLHEVALGNSVLFHFGVEPGMVRPSVIDLFLHPHLLCTVCGLY